MRVAESASSRRFVFSTKSVSRVTPQLWPILILFFSSKIGPSVLYENFQSQRILEFCGETCNSFVSCVSVSMVVLNIEISSKELKEGQEKIHKLSQRIYLF